MPHSNAASPSHSFSFPLSLLGLVVVVCWVLRPQTCPPPQLLFFKSLRLQGQSQRRLLRPPHPCYLPASFSSFLTFLSSCWQQATSWPSWPLVLLLLLLPRRLALLHRSSRYGPHHLLHCPHHHRRRHNGHRWAFTLFQVKSANNFGKKNGFVG